MKTKTKITGEMVLAQANAHYQSIVVAQAKEKGIDVSYQPPEIIGEIESRQVKALAYAIADFLNYDENKHSNRS